jgi:hypothetical protein
LTTPHTSANDPDQPFYHGIEVVRRADGVDLVDTLAAGRPSVRLTLDEYEAFLAGVRNGEFDWETLTGHHDKDGPDPGG